MAGITEWVESIFATENAEGIIAISALIAWLLPKLIYFCFKLFFNTLLFIANVLGRDEVELWLKNKINRVLANVVEGAKVDDIPRWLNKDQLALRELHWEHGCMVVDVPSVIVTINLPTFGYNVVKLKLRYLCQKAIFKDKLRELVHNCVREVRIQEPVITYNLPQEALLEEAPQAKTGKTLERKDSMLALYREAVGYHLHVLIEHGQLQVSAFGQRASLQNVNLDIYNRASLLDKDENGYLLSFLLTALYEGANVSLCNKVDSLTDYLLVIDHAFVTLDMWQALCKRCPGLQELQFTESGRSKIIGKLKYIRMEFSLEEHLKLSYLDCEYRVNKPQIKSWHNWESPASFEGRLGWDEHGLQLVDNFLLFANGFRLRIPCTWQEGKLVLEFPSLEKFKEQYQQVVKRTKDNMQSYREKVTDNVHSYKDRVTDKVKETVKKKVKSWL